MWAVNHPIQQVSYIWGGGAGGGSYVKRSHSYVYIKNKNNNSYTQNVKNDVSLFHNDSNHLIIYSETRLTRPRITRKQ